MAAQSIRIPADNLVEYSAAIFRDAGCSDTDAMTVARCLVQSNLWGIDSHGVLRLPDYLGRLRSGAMNARPAIRAAQSAPGLEVLDADNGPGFLAASAAMSRAIELARAGNIAAVGIVNSNHCGAAALYARMAADSEMIGIAMSNVAPNMVTAGCSAPVTGNNPFAIAIPTFGQFPFVLDISLSAVAGGKLLAASSKGEQIPLGWATDKDGRPTTDPKAGFDGFLLPMGGHKGFGLSLAIDILCGLVTGGSFQHHLKSMYRYPADPSNTAHMMMVINPLAIMPRAQLASRFAEFFDTVRGSPRWDGGETLLPGEIEHRAELERRRDGIPVPATLYETLVRIGAESRLAVELRPVPAVVGI
jgi:LDH2 family malate/lactate/ureidoglycolate dehydrogenase